MLRKAIISAIILILAVAAWGAAMRSFASQPVSVDYRGVPNRRVEPVETLFGFIAPPPQQVGDSSALPPRNPEERVRLASTQRVATGENFGLCFVSAAENLADETRYAGALETGAQWDRWPLYWQWVDQGGYVGYHDTAIPHDYDALVIQEIEHGLTPIAILLGTPDQRATGGSADVPPPRVQDKVFLVPGQVALQQAETSTAASPPVGLFEPIFADGADVPAPGKAINQTNSWADFVANTVQRYKPGGVLAQDQGWGDGVGIRYWEIWNEPDLDQFWSGTVEEYYRLLEVGYQTIQAADPEATVILGGLAFFEKQNWLSDLLAQTGGDPARAYFDVVSFHYYWSIYGTEYWLWRTRSTLSANGLSHVPIWITESGVPVWDDFPATEFDGGVPSDSPYRGTMEEQAAYVIQNAALALFQGVEQYYHFMLHDDCGNVPGADAFGLRQNFTPHVCSPAQGKRRPAFAAYQLAAEQFRDLTPIWRTAAAGCAAGSGCDQVAFYRADDNSRVLALWATGGAAVNATIGATGHTGQLYWVESISSELGTTGITRALTLTPTSGVYTLTLPPATNQNSGIPGDTSYYIGGRPYLLVERDTLPPTSSVEALPPTSGPHFVVRWGGEDLGSGIASYDVWFNDDGGSLQVWMTGTTATSASFSGVVGHSYGFAVRARDQAANEEPIPATPQASTLVVSGVPVSGTVIDAGGKAVVGATVTISDTNMSEVTSSEGGLWSAALSEGEYTFHASAPGYGTWPAPHRVTVSDSTHVTLTLAPPVNAVAVGDFEGAGVWDAWARLNGEVSLSTEAFDGQAAVLLGSGDGRPVTCAQNGQPGELWTLKQTVSVPQGYQSSLSFLSAISTTQADFDYAWLEVVIVDNGQPYYLVPWGELWRASDWTLTSLDLSAWQGQAVDVLFQVVHCSAQSFTATLDRVSVGSARPPYRLFIPLTKK